jgi:antitoxin (DNA-binding transcriptional repressor) of toxin-antitoxin stability system
MNLTATDFRQKLFSALEAAAKGEGVVITHKNRTFRLHAENTATWLEQVANRPRPAGIKFVEPVESPWNEEAWLDKWKRRKR